MEGVEEVDDGSSRKVAKIRIMSSNATHRVKRRDTVFPHKCPDLFVRNLIRVCISRPEMRCCILFVRLEVENTLHTFGASESEDKADTADYCIEIVF